MAYEERRAWNPSRASRALVEVCNSVVEELSDYQLTLRQLYYQLVSRNIIPNTERSYKNLGNVVVRARMAGLMDWNAIEDRVRRPVVPSQWRDVNSIVEAAIEQFRLPRWRDQNSYVELWVEKDALASVLAPLARRFHVTLMVNRGYSSASAMKESAERFREHFVVQDLVLLYLGDLDPSGEDMVRDIDTRLCEFGVSVDVRKIALTMEQVEEYDPPPNPAKRTDARSRAFIERYGNNSWEVDALPPVVLEQIIETAILEELDEEIMQRVIAEEERQRRLVRERLGIEEENDDD